MVRCVTKIVLLLENNKPCNFSFETRNFLGFWVPVTKPEPEISKENLTRTRPQPEIGFGLLYPTRPRFSGSGSGSNNFEVGSGLQTFIPCFTVDESKFSATTVPGILGTPPKPKLYYTALRCALEFGAVLDDFSDSLFGSQLTKSFQLRFSLCTLLLVCGLVSHQCRRFRFHEKIASFCPRSEASINARPSQKLYVCPSVILRPQECIERAKNLPTDFTVYIISQTRS